MAKFVIREPPRFTERYLSIFMTKTSDEDAIIVQHEDTMETVAEIRVEERTRNLIVTAADSPRIKLIENDGSIISTPVRKFDDAVEESRSWAIDEDDEGQRSFHVWLTNGSKLVLPVHEPGPFTPADSPDSPIHELHGQEEMLFAVCLGLSLGRNTLLTGPTGIGKTSVYRWLASKLGYNLIVQSVSRGTQDRHLLGEYAPAGPGDFRWTDGPTTMAARASREHPTILLLDEINRVGNVAEFARVYPLLDDQHRVELPEKRHESGDVEVIQAGDLHIVATANPVDDDGADYIGVKELDPAFSSRFPLQPRLGYPPEENEARALAARVEWLDRDIATKMVQCANRVRTSAEVRFPMSFRELEAWALVMPYFGYSEAAEIAVISKCPAVFRPDVRNLLLLQGDK